MYLLKKLMINIIINSTWYFRFNLASYSSGIVSIWKGENVPIYTIKTISGKEHTDKYIKKPTLSKALMCQKTNMIATGGCENDLKLWDMIKPNKPIYQAKNVRFWVIEYVWYVNHSFVYRFH